jgi:hypothetical protein
MKLNKKPTLFVDEICNPTLDKSRLTQIPEHSRLTQLPLDASTLAQLPVDTSRLMRLPPDVSALMRLPIDPNSEVEREFFAKRPEPEYIEEDELVLEAPRSAGRRIAALVVALVVVAAGGVVAARSRQPSGAPLPAAATRALSAPDMIPPPAPSPHAARLTTARSHAHAPR